jgi:hypothetical protein
MTQLTFRLASTHDHWFDEPATEHTLVAVRLRWRHFAKHHPTVVEALEWAIGSLVGLTILSATLIANAQ